jgi:mRNA interferase MazF
MMRGDIILVDLPQPKMGGHEQFGKRPAIVIDNDKTSSSLPTLIVIPVTGSLTALRFPYTVRIDPSSQNSLTTPSVALIFQLRAIDKRRIITTTGRLEKNYLQAIDVELKRLLNL